MMRSKCTVFLAYALGTALYLSSSVAQGDELELTILRTRPGAAALDTGALRSALETELHSAVIPQSDPRSGSAKGTLTIDVDPKGEELLVTYLANAKPLTRRVSLPKEKSVAERTLILLAGNLARDEGGDLVAQLRKRPRSEAGAREECLETPPAPQESLEVGRADHERDASRLQATLDYYAGSDRKSRRAVGFALAAAGAAAAGVTVYAGVRSKEAGVWIGAGTGAAVLLGEGVLALVSSRPLEDLAEYGHRVGKGYAEYTEQAWVSEAAREHRLKRTVGIIGLVSSGATIGLSTWLLLNRGIASNKTSWNYGVALPLMGLGMIEGAVSVYQLASEGPVETSLHAYERSSGRTLGAPPSSRPRVQVGLTSSGFFAAMSGTF